MLKIKHTDYQSLCEYTYEGGDVPPSGIVYVPMDHICDFFTKVRDSQKEYIVVSANSDYGFCYQQDNPVSVDMKKWLKFVDFGDLGYEDLTIPARCFKPFCKITDKYASKMHTFTNATIDFIPECVKKWFSTNNEVADERIVQIPVGVPDWTYYFLYKQTKKENKIYVNFSPNNLVRAEIFHTNNPLFFRSRTVDKPEYVGHLRESKYVLCPPGNGLDTFRVCETLYCGSIPIVFNTPHNNVYGDLVIRIDSLDQLSLDFLENTKVGQDLEMSTVDFNYWKSICRN